MITQESEKSTACYLSWKDLRYNWHDDLCLNREEAIRKAEEVIKLTNPRPEEMPTIRVETRQIIKFKNEDGS